MPENQINLETVTAYLKENTIPVNKEVKQCVDGREVTYGMARPGGDGGYVMGLLSLNKELNWGLSVSEVVDMVYKVSTENGGKFFIHTDDHVDPKDGHHHHGEAPKEYAIGCGHMSLASDPKNSEEYRISSEDMKEAVIMMRGMKKEGKNVSVAVLEGNHREGGALVNIGTEIKPKHSTDKDMFFVYDKTLDTGYVERTLIPGVLNIKPELSKKGLSSDSMQKVLDVQTAATLHHLALGKPVFEVNADNPKNIKVKPLGKIA